MKPQMPEPFTIEKLVPLMDEAGVDRAVIVPPSWPGDRNDYGLEAAKRYPDRFAVMGRIPLKNPQSAALLPKWKEQPGMLGVRVTFLGPAAAWLTDGTADWFWPAAEKAGLPVMFLTPGRSARARPRRRAPPAAHADRRPHGRGRRRREGRQARRRDRPDGCRSPSIRTSRSSCRRRPTTRPKPIRSATSRPHIRRLFDAYGPQRCYWGTDLTNGFDQGDLPPAHHPFHRGAARSCRRRTRTGSWDAPSWHGSGLGHEISDDRASPPVEPAPAKGSEPCR